MSGAPTFIATLGIGVTIIAIVLGGVIKITRSWSRLESDLRTTIRDFDVHVTTERAERVEMTARVSHDIEALANRVTLLEREAVRLGGFNASGGSA